APPQEDECVMQRRAHEIACGRQGDALVIPGVVAERGRGRDELRGLSAVRRRSTLAAEGKQLAIGGGAAVAGAATVEVARRVVERGAAGRQLAAGGNRSGLHFRGKGVGGGQPAADEYRPRAGVER